jgi:hypothetical protein
MKKKRNRVGAPPAAIVLSREPSSHREPSSAKKSSNPSEPSRLSGLLDPYATKRVTRFFVIIGAIWGGVSLLALSLWNRNLWDDMPGSYFWLDVAVVLVCDTLLAGLLISGCKSLLRLKSARPFYKGLVSLLLSCAAVTAVLFVSLLSWIFCARHIGFLTRGSVISTLLDFPSISPFLSFRESLTLGATLSVASAVVLAMTAKAPLLSRRQFLVLGGVFCIPLLTILVSFRVLPGLRLSEVNAQRSEGIVEARLLPTATLLWAPLVLHDPYSGKTVTAPLARRYDLDAYAARIDRKRQRPNIIVFSIESLRAGEVHRIVDGRQVMPTVSRLAKQGVDFTRVRTGE